MLYRCWCCFCCCWSPYLHITNYTPAVVQPRPSRLKEYICKQGHATAAQLYPVRLARILKWGAILLYGDLESDLRVLPSVLECLKKADPDIITKLM